jgi:hypothetical protein
MRGITIGVFVLWLLVFSHGPVRSENEVRFEPNRFPSVPILLVSKDNALCSKLLRRVEARFFQDAGRNAAAWNFKSKPKMEDDFPKLLDWENFGENGELLILKIDVDGDNVKEKIVQFPHSFKLVTNYKAYLFDGKMDNSKIRHDVKKYIHGWNVRPIYTVDNWFGVRSFDLIKSDGWCLESGGNWIAA